jgi:FAD:protein FMN transferase
VPWWGRIASNSMPFVCPSASSSRECGLISAASPRVTSYRRRSRRCDIVVGDAPPGRKGWTIDVSCGDAPFRARASSLANSALSTSGPTNQFIEIDGVRYSHVIDPRTGFGITNPTVAHVIASDAATADALATALTVVGHQGAIALASQFPGVMICLTS